MDNIGRHFEGITNQISRFMPRKTEDSKHDVSSLAQKAMETGGLKTKDLSHIAAVKKSDGKTGSAIRSLFSKNVGKSNKTQTLDWSESRVFVEGEATPEPRIADRQLPPESNFQQEVRQQIKQAVDYVETYGDELKARAAKKKQTIHLKPSLRQRLTDFFRGKHFKKGEKKADIFVHENGDVSIMPKHARLDFGKPKSTEYYTRWNQFTPQNKSDVLFKQMLHPDPSQRPSLETIGMALSLASNEAVADNVFEASIGDPGRIMTLFQDEKLNELASLFFEEKNLDTQAKQQVLLQLKDAQNFLQDRAEDLRQRANEANEPIYIRADKIGGGKDKDARYRGCHIQVNPDGKIYLIPKHPKLWINKGALKKLRMAVEIGPDDKPNRAVAFASVRPVGQSFDIARQEVETINELLSRRGGEMDTIGIKVFKELGRDQKSKAKVILPYANMGGINARRLNPDVKSAVMKGCVEWIHFMHENHYVNLDIKEANFLGFRAKDGEIDVLGLDLDQAKTVENNGMVIPRGGTIPYMSPELIATILHNSKEADIPEEYQSCDGFKADIFALGKTLLFLEQGGYDKSFEFIQRDPETKAPVGFDEAKYISIWNEFDPETPVQILAKAMIHPNPQLRPDSGRVNDLLNQIAGGSLKDTVIIRELGDSLSKLPIPKASSAALDEKTQSLSDHYPIHEINENGAAEKLKDKGSWLLRQGEGGKIYFHYRNQKSGEIEMMPLISSDIEAVRELVNFNIEQKIIAKNRLVNT